MHEVYLQTHLPPPEDEEEAEYSDLSKTNLAVHTDESSVNSNWFALQITDSTNLQVVEVQDLKRD